jgi:subtilisin family serine protease
MRKVIVFIWAFVLLSVPLSAMAQIPEERSGVVSQELYAQLESSPDATAYAIVMLRPVLMPKATLPEIQAAVQAIQHRVLAKLTADEFSIVYQYKNFAGMTGHVNEAGLAKLAKDPDVVAVGPDALGVGHLDDSVPFINADDVHALGYTGFGITVGVLDTGIDSDHPDLSDNIVLGWYHFLDQGGNTGAGAEDDNGHGTNVSGIITSKGVVAPVGVAPDAGILAIKVLKANGSGWISDWAAGVDYVVAHKNDYFNLCAINMSLGSDDLFSNCPCDNVNTWTQLLQTAIQAAKNAGIVTFASSGNNGSCTSMCAPACVSAAVAVAAVYDQDLGREPDANTYGYYYDGFGYCFDATTAGDKITCFSNRANNCNELAAPGRLITAPGMGGGTSTYTGTSQAAPHCAGVAALMCEKCVDIGASLTPDQIVQIMKNTGAATDDPCSTFPNPIRVDALAAVDAVGAPPPIPTLTEWGLIIFGVVLVGLITWVFLRRRRAVVSLR